MATTFWTGNGQAIAQVDTLTVTAVPGAGGGTLTATINGKSITYTTLAADTTTTAAAAWQALLAASTVPPEFLEITWTQSGAVVTATAAVQGQPFTLTSSAGAGATLTQAHPTANSSPNDVNNANNWLRAGVASLPQAPDDVILGDSSVSLLWNLAALAAVAFNTLKRYNSFTGQIGLPENNPAGYFEYRATYFKFIGPAGALPATLGLGSGTGPSLEKYDVGSQNTTWQIFGSRECHILDTSASSTFTINGATVLIAALPAEVSTVSGGVTVVNGGALTLGSGVTFAGTLTLDSGAVVFCETAPTTVNMKGASTFISNHTGGTVTALTVQENSVVVWLGTDTITTMTLNTGSRFEKSGDNRGATITNSTIDRDCQIIDPWNAVTYTNATTVNGPVTAGPFVFGSGRTVKVV